MFRDTCHNLKIGFSLRIFMKYGFLTNLSHTIEQDWFWLFPILRYCSFAVTFILDFDLNNKQQLFSESGKRHLGDDETETNTIFPLQQQINTFFYTTKL